MQLQRQRLLGLVVMAYGDCGDHACLRLRKLDVGAVVLAKSIDAADAVVGVLEDSDESLCVGQVPYHDGQRCFCTLQHIQLQHYPNRKQKRPSDVTCRKRTQRSALKKSK